MAEVIAEFDADDLANRVTMHVRIKGMASWRLRLWIAKKLIWSACRVAGFGRLNISHEAESHG